MINFFEKENKSLKEGFVVLLEENGKPYSDCERIWFVWYRFGNTNYRILLKTFSTRKDFVIEKISKLKENLEMESGLGFWDLKNGKCCFLKPNVFSLEN